MHPLPTYVANPLFETRFTPFDTLPGFFPGAGGFFHGHANPRRRFLFFGTDFGPLDYQRTLGSTGGEPPSVTTIRNLLRVVTGSGMSPGDCVLTNAVLCMRQGPSAMSQFPIWTRYPDYVAACAAWHQSVLQEEPPFGVVLMGLAHLQYFGKLLFPELGGVWAGMRKLSDVYAAGLECVRLASGIEVLLMHHPSMIHFHPAAATSSVEGHLARWAREVGP